MHDLAAGGGTVDSLLLTPRPEVRKVGYIVISADRGLCGAYNSSVIRAAERAIQDQRGAGSITPSSSPGESPRATSATASTTSTPRSAGSRSGRRTKTRGASGAAATQLFLTGDVDVVEIVSTRFVSVGTQIVERQRLMPLARDEVVADPAHGVDAMVQAAYEFEPSPEGILDLLLPRYVDARVYAALLNAAASEHAARQRAMKSATDNAEDLITNLTRGMNRARQDAITTEIMEIVGGAEALRGRARHDDLLADTIEGRESDLFAARGGELTNSDEAKAWADARDAEAESTDQRRRNRSLQ